MTAVAPLKGHFFAIDSRIWAKVTAYVRIPVDVGR